jgi:hypothetical protein
MFMYLYNIYIYIYIYIYIEYVYSQDYHCHIVISRLFKQNCDFILVALEESKVSFKKFYTIQELYVKLTIVTDVLIKGEKSYLCICIYLYIFMNMYIYIYVYI